jgi:hypothetical protein
VKFIEGIAFVLNENDPTKAGKIIKNGNEVFIIVNGLFDWFIEVHVY